MTLHIGAEEKREAPILKEEEDSGALAIDIFEDAEKIIILAPVAGVDEASVEIVLTEDLLSIKGNRPRPDSIPKNARFFVEECFWGKFSRSVLLPTAVNSAEISARLDRDILYIDIPKARKAASKIISLKK